MTLALRGELGQAGGWQGRAERLLEREQAGDCVERGYLLILRGIEHEIDGDRERLAAIAAEAVAASASASLIPTCSRWVHSCRAMH